MKKVVYVNIPMRKGLTKQRYQAAGNKTIQYNKETYYAINSVLGARLKKNEELKIILIKSIGGDKNGDNNIQILIDEFNEINKTIGANPEFKIINAPFETSKDSNERLFNLLLNEIDENDEIIADITYGPKTIPMLILSVFTFAEKFLNAKIGNIVYGKVEFIDNKPVNPQLCDITSLYFINSFINTIEYNNPQKAKEILNKLFNLERG